MSILEAFLAGKEARRVADAAEQINAMQSFIGQNGQAIMAGDQNALGQLAGFGVQGLQTAMGIQGNLEDRARATKADARADQEYELRMKEYAAGLTAEQRAAEAAKIDEVLAGASHFYSTGNQAGYVDWLTKQGLDPAQYPFADFPAHALKGQKALEALKATQPETPKPADDYQRYVQEEQAAGREPLTRIEFANAMKGNGVTQTIRNPDGTETTIQIGGPAGGPAAGEVTVGDVYDPNEIQGVVEMIDEIAKDPALPQVVGNRALLVGGGNQVAEMNTFQRMAYGTGGLNVIEKIGQLQSNAWLAARKMLKGGGPITDYESRKAEAAVARLERPKDVKDYVAALQELRDAITEGEAKLRAAQGGETVTTPKRLKWNPETEDFE